MNIPRWECVATWYFEGDTPDWSAADECEEHTAVAAVTRYAERHDVDGVLLNDFGVVRVHVRPHGSAGPVEVFEVTAEAQVVYSAARVEAKGVA